MQRPWRIEAEGRDGKWRAYTTLATREAALRDVGWWKRTLRPRLVRIRNRVTGEVVAS